MRAPFSIQSARHRALSLSSNRLVNWMPEVQAKDAKAPTPLIPTPGLDNFASVSLPLVSDGSPPVRCMHPIGTRLLTVTGPQVVVYDQSGGPRIYGRPLIYGSEPLVAADNGSIVFLVSPETAQAWIYDPAADTVTEMADADFPGATSVAWLNGRFYVTVPGSGRVYFSALNDPSSWDALDFINAEGSPDVTVRVVRSDLSLFLMGATSTEVWANTGGDAVLERLQGAFFARGVAARHSVAEWLGAVHWVGDDRVVYRTDQSRPVRISTHPLEQAIGGYERVDDARGWCYSQDGHVFYVLTFPDAGVTWVYDWTTQVWHERQSSGRDTWLCHTGCMFGGQPFGGSDAGGVYRLNPTSSRDRTATVSRSATLPAIHAEDRRVFLSRFALDLEAGVGERAGRAHRTDPRVWLEWSDDGGHTWSSALDGFVGKRGEYRRRVEWRRLGASRERVFRVTLADPVWTVLIAANLEVEAGAD